MKKTIWETMLKKIEEGNARFEKIVPGRSDKDRSKNAEILYYGLSWFAGFMGGKLPEKELSDLFSELEGLASPVVTSGKIDWANAGREYRKKVHGGDGED